MHPIEIGFWIFFGCCAAWIGWSFLQMFLQWRGERQPPVRTGGPAVREGNAHGGVASIGGVDSMTDLSSAGSSTYGDLGHGDSGSDSSSGGDFSGGGGESGGGGASGGW